MCSCASTSGALERAFDLFMRIPQCDGPAVRTAGGMLGFSQFASSSQSIFAASSGMLILTAAWQAMLAAMRRRRASAFSDLLAGDRRRRGRLRA